MSAVVPVPASLLGFTPLAPEHWAIVVILLAAKAGAVWFFWHKKKALIQQQKDEAAATGQAHATVLQAQKDAAAAQVAAAQQKLDAAAAAHQHLEAQHKDHVETAHRREQENAQRIAALSADLAATREVAAQFQPAQMRIKDLEAALASERGRVGALEKAVEVSNKRATDFETRLEQAHLSVTELRQSSAQREGELQADMARLQQTIQANEALVSSAESQITQATETLSSYKQQAETRIANLQRQLAAAEAKSALVQKEFMSAVGVLPDNPAPSPRKAAVAGDDKRIAELEAKITQIEADARKKAREDGYKIAELEFRLTDAQESLAAAKAAQAAQATAATPAQAIEAPVPEVVVPDPAPTQISQEGSEEISSPS